jgi:Leucine-rich repeat (LRR) protein
MGVTSRQSTELPTWCYFYGITCNSNPTDLNFGTIDDIELDDLGLVGKFPTSMSSFAQLKSLSMRNNRIMDSIPSSIGALSSLTSLRLSNNQLTGTIPCNIMSLQSLTFLDLSTNFLDGIVPYTEKNGHLKYVNIDMNYLVHNSNEQESQQRRPTKAVIQSPQTKEHSSKDQSLQHKKHSSKETRSTPLLMPSKPFKTSSHI